jgi:hypothetical protein
MNRIDDSQRVAARIAGVSGLLAVVIVVVGNYVLLGPLVVPGNAAATASRAHLLSYLRRKRCRPTFGPLCDP